MLKRAARKSTATGKSSTNGLSARQKTPAGGQQRQDQVVEDPYWAGFPEEYAKDHNQTRIYDNVMKMRFERSSTLQKIKIEPDLPSSCQDMGRNLVHRLLDAQHQQDQGVRWAKESAGEVEQAQGPMLSNRSSASLNLG